MQFESKTTRLYWVTALAGLIPDMLLALLVAFFFSGGVSGVFVAFFGLQLIYLVLWIKKSVWGWVLFRVMGRKALAEAILSDLQRVKFPEPAECERSADSYFEWVALDESQPIDVRLVPSSQITMLKLPGAKMRIQGSIRLALGYEDALAAYKKMFATQGNVSVGND
ncbi:MAG: hypothetical protein ABI612_16525 [Betaproteobacteria bacterium]